MSETWSPDKQELWLRENRRSMRAYLTLWSPAIAADKLRERGIMLSPVAVERFHKKPRRKKFSSPRQPGRAAAVIKMRTAGTSIANIAKSFGCTKPAIQYYIDRYAPHLKNPYVSHVYTCSVCGARAPRYRRFCTRSCFDARPITQHQREVWDTCMWARSHGYAWSVALRLLRMDMPNARTCIRRLEKRGFDATLMFWRGKDEWEHLQQTWYQRGRQPTQAPTAGQIFPNTTSTCSSATNATVSS